MLKKLLSKIDFGMACRKGLCVKNLHRPHIHCLTCLDRRWYYDSNDRPHLHRINAGEQFVLATTKNPLTLPQNLKLRHFMINNDFRGPYGKVKKYVKEFVLRPLMSICEVIANW